MSKTRPPMSKEAQDFINSPRFQEMLAKVRKPKPAVAMSISAEMREDIRNNPDSVRLSVRRSDGTVRVERPKSPRTGTISEPELIKQLGEVEGRREYERIRADSISRRDRDLEPTEFGRPRDKYWVEQRSRYSGEVWFRPDDGSNSNVVSSYHPWDGLRKD
jgi:hypothetical protein